MKKDFEPVKGGCIGCPLQGHTVVFPSGKMKDCKLVIVGQAPGATEIEEGKPFVGRAGKKLWDELNALGISRKQCYVTNIAKCRPPKNAKGSEAPDAATVRHCSKQFEKEWARLKKARIHHTVLILGDIASKKLLKRALSSVNGRIIDDLGDNNAYLPVWHPSYIIRGHVNDNNSIVWRRKLSLLTSLLNKPKAKPFMDYVLVADVPHLRKVVDGFLSSKDALSVDIETSTKLPSAPGAEIICMALYNGNGPTHVLDFTKLGTGKVVARLLKELLESKVPKIAQNAKFEYVWLRYHFGVHLNNIWFDPAMARYLLDKGAGTSVALKQMVWRYFPEWGGYESGVDYENMAGLPSEVIHPYCATDAYLTRKLAFVLKKELEEEGFDFVFREVLLPAIYAVGEMEAVGLKLDTELIGRRITELQESIAQTEQELLGRKAVKKVEDFKITSTHKLRELFFKVLRKPVMHRTATGQEALTQVELNTWGAGGNEEARLILSYRQSYKLLRTYFMNYLEMSTGEGFLHPSYNMVVAKGGRLTSSSPNIQNVPPEVREVFVSRFSNGVLLQMDFKQIEMRVMAIEANDKGLIKIFKQGGDPHKMVASEILGIPIDEITPEQRKGAKATGFGLIYGMVAKTLAEREGIPLREAERFYNGFFRRFKGVKRWQDAQRRKVLRGEEIRSLFGRVRDLSVYPDEEKVNRAYNFPIQSCASDINLYFLSLVWHLMRQSRLLSVLIATVHDSLLIDCHPDEVQTVKNILEVTIEALPEHFEWMTVPMDIDVATGPNWKEAK